MTPLSLTGPAPSQLDADREAFSCQRPSNHRLTTALALVLLNLKPPLLEEFVHHPPREVLRLEALLSPERPITHLVDLVMAVA